MTMLVHDKAVFAKAAVLWVSLKFNNSVMVALLDSLNGILVGPRE